MKARRIAFLMVLFVTGCALGFFLYPPLVRWMVTSLNTNLTVNDLDEVFRTRLHFALLCGLLLTATCLCTLISRPDNIVLTTIIYFTIGSAVAISYAFYCQNKISSVVYDYQLVSSTTWTQTSLSAGNSPLLRIPLSGICTIVALSLIHRLFWPRKGWEPFTD